MRFGILGPVVVHDGARTLTPTARKPRTLLAILLCQPGHTVATDRLVDLLWDGTPPRSADQNLRGYVAYLRRALRDPNRISHQPSGYTLVAEPDEIDAYQFDLLSVEGRRQLSGGDAAAAAATLRLALAQWRGPALADLAGHQALSGDANRLEERKIAAIEHRVDADLAVGQHAWLIPELLASIEEHPLRERLRAQLMIALSRAGRPAEALAVYRETRKLYVAELGIEPGPDLRDLHQAILAGSTSATRPAAAAAAPVTVVAAPVTSTGPVVAQLPIGTSSFCGRAETLVVMDQVLRTVPRTAVVTLTGTAGVGKTALAVHWAHRVRSFFPDGQLYADLRGFDASAPVRTIAVLARFLRALGVPAGRVPWDLDEAAALYRSVLDGRQVLVLLDNVNSVDQVRPLLPGTPGCMVLATSRERLSGLVAAEGVTRIPVGVLDADEAVTLLARVLGTERVETEPTAAAALARACAYLPLALRIAAANLADEPDDTLAQMVRRVSADDELATLTVAGDGRAAVRAAFDQSYGRLPAPARRLLRMFGLLPGADLTAPAAAALLGVRLGLADEYLQNLHTAHLVDQPTPGRFACHDLLRRYATLLAETEEPAGARRAATERLAGWYIAGAGAAALLATGPVQGPPLPPPPTGVVPPSFADGQAALTWLDAELPNLVAATHWAAAGLMPAATGWQLASALRGYLLLRRPMPEWLATARAGLATARFANDLAGQAVSRLLLAQAHRSAGRYPTAIAHFQGARRLARAAQEVTLEAAILGNLAGVFWELGRLTEAHTRLAEALELNLSAAAEPAAMVNHHNLGTLLREMGRPAEPEGQLRFTAGVGRATASANILGHAQTNLGEVYHYLGRFDEARRCLEEGLRIHREVGDRRGEAVVRASLAHLYCDSNQRGAALAEARAAVTLAEAVGNALVLADSHIALGAAHLRAEAMDAAAAAYSTGLRVAGDGRYARFAALTGLATVELRRERYAQAARWAEEARAMALESGYRLLEACALITLTQIATVSGRPAAADDYAARAAAIYQSSRHYRGATTVSVDSF